MPKDPSNLINEDSQAGFSLVEMIVAIGIFAVVMTVSLVGLMSVIDATQDEQARSEAVDNTNFVIDDMIRRIRIGYNFECGGPGGGNCASGGEDELTFTTSRVDPSGGSDPEYGYRRQGNYLQRLEDGSWSRVTPESVVINSLEFFVTGTSGLDGEQTRVMISLIGEVAGGGGPEQFSLNTTVTQRLLYPPQN